MTTLINHESDFVQLISKKYHSSNVISNVLPDTKILEISDEFFADAAHLLKPSPPIQKANVFTDRGAWYDGWETRRHNPAEFDYVIIRSGVKKGSKIVGCEVDTTFFTGNNGEYFEVEGSFLDDFYGECDLKQLKWDCVVAKSKLEPTQRHFYLNTDGLTEKSYNIFKFKMFPDGGISRFRLYGRVEHYSSPSNLLLPGSGYNMGDGWETKRSRDKGHTDWAIVKLGKKIEFVHRIVVDTTDFKGNFPNYFKVLGLSSYSHDEVSEDDERWETLIDETKGIAHKVLEIDLNLKKDITHVMLVLIPDGGCKRIRVIGH
ncbi:unnamed protein product [Hanseniaspora opuntiae]